MAEEYKPSRREVLSQMGKDVKGLAKTISNSGKQIKDFAKGFAVISGTIATFPYYILKDIRAITEESKPEKEVPQAKFAGGVCGFFTGIGFLAAQMYGYYYAIENEHSEVCLLPLATNIVSGAYELGRMWYRSAADKVKAKSLNP